MTVYTVKSGDTFDRISTIAYGSSGFADLIRSANPHASGGLSVGMVLNIPAQTVRDISRRTVRAEQENEVTIKIDGAPFRFWTSIQLTRSIDAFDAFRLNAPFDKSNTLFRDAFRPFDFQNADLFLGSDPLFTGTLVNTPASVSETDSLVSASGYSLAGVLNDVTVPAGEPIEYDNLNLQGIAESMSKPFGLAPVFLNDAGPAIERVAVSQSGKIWPFWVKLAQQRGLVIGANELGQPLFQKTADGAPVQNLAEGELPVRSVTPQFNPQQYYSHISAITPSVWGGEGEVYTVENPHLRGVLRPFTFTADDTFGADSTVAARAKMGRMFANAIHYTVNLVGWRDSSGREWRPNTRVRLLAPSAMIRSSFEFLIRTVTFSRDAKSETAQLDLVFPESFDSGVPEVLPWEV
jgi:prophage tail gpP-like protein